MAKLKMTKDELTDFLRSLPKPERDGVEALLIDDDAAWGALDLDMDQLRAVHRHMKLIIEQDPPPADDADEDRIKMWARYGLAVSVPEGRSSRARSMMLAEHDGVPYCVNDYSHFNCGQGDFQIIRSIQHRQMMIDCYHNKIKAVYEYCTSLNLGHIWVLCSGGLQVQAFFGCSEGYLGIMYFDLETRPYETQEQRENLNQKVHSLFPQFDRGLFDQLNIAGVKVKITEHSIPKKG